MIPSFPRYSATGGDRANKVLDIERMHGSRAKYHVYFTVNGVLHTHASWAKTKEAASISVATIAQEVHRGAKYALVGVVRLNKVDV